MAEASGPHLAGAEHVAYCFDVLCGHFQGGLKKSSLPSFSSALFVTWNTIQRGGRERLRGCIGTLEPKQLPKALEDYALTSAFHDRRFPAITADEVPKLSCTVSLLHSFEEAADWTDWSIGTHGLIIRFRDPDTRVRRSATFLPGVASGEAWSHLETLEHLVLKAGYRGSASNVLDSLEITRYQSSTFSMTHSEYFAHRNRDGSEHVTGANIAVPVPA